MKIITESQCTSYSKAGHPEKPERVSRTAEYLRAQTDMELTWGSPVEVADSLLLRAHSPSLLKRLEVPEDFDADTPYFAGIAQLARRSVGGAIAALDATCAGDCGFSLMRPPGHHAMRNAASGFCYLNTIAIMALEAQARGLKRVVIYDFDVHHGNGTEDIMVDQPGTSFISIHQSGYPFTGKTNRGTNCFNFCVPGGSSREEYRNHLSRALEKAKEFKPDLLAISAGFDAYGSDPLSEQKLEIADYHWLGQMIRDTKIPVCGILEGGYSNMLPVLVASYLRGLAGKPFVVPVTGLSPTKS